MLQAAGDGGLTKDREGMASAMPKSPAVESAFRRWDKGVWKRKFLHIGAGLEFGWTASPATALN